MNETILLIDDDTALLRLAELNLKKEGYRVVCAAHGILGLQMMETERPALILLDVSMPKLDGWETCRLIREISDVPVIMLTGRDDEFDKARGLDLGADDYLTKPFSFVELQARMRATLRRAKMPSTTKSAQKSGIYQVGPLLMDVPMHRVTRDDKAVALTPTEFRVLEYLLRHVNMVLSHHQLLSAIWGAAYSDAVELLKPTISRLRQKIEEDPTHPRLIQTVHGVGYRLMQPPTEMPR